MRLGLVASAAALLGAASPASAAVYMVSISGLLTGNTTTVLCTGGPTCLPPNAERVDPYSSTFNLSLGALDLVQGSNSFSTGSPYAGFGAVSGTINNNNGLLTGLNLTFYRQSCAPGQPPVGCQRTSASAATFNVAGGVPEPASWALMLLGFGAVGTAMRRRRPIRARVTFAR